uniref:AC4 n=1 Tax=Ascaris lumbricoides TaxID=6252 RepID=A0A0M3IWI6_ASCLU
MLDYFTLPSTVDHLKSNSGRPSQVDHYFTISSHGPRSTIPNHGRRSTIPHRLRMSSTI